MSHKDEKKKDETLELQEEAVQVINKTEEYIHSKRKAIWMGLIAIIVIVGSVLVYRNFVQKPRAAKAEEALFKAEYYFDRDSFATALNGNGADVVGFLEVINKYKGTKSANLAHAYAGISLYHLGQPGQALEHLKKFKGKDIMISPAVHGLIGDCYVELGKTEESIRYFEEAAKRADNALLSPIYLLKAGKAYEAIGKMDQALKAYESVKEKYFNSPSVAEAEKYIQAIKLRQ